MPATTVCLNHLEFNWPSSDGLMLFAQGWIPETRPKAIINYVHGFKDHSSRFEAWAQKLSREGFGVLSIDLRGHGRSEGRRGFAAHYDLYLQDVRELCIRSKEMFPEIPHILYGHSLGGSLVTNYLLKGIDLPSAAVIASPWFTLTFRPSLFTLTGATLLKFLLPFVIVRSDLDANGLSHNPEVAENYRRDPLVHNKISPRLFFEIEEKGLKASHNIYKINIPLLVMHGSADTITSCRQTRSFVLNAGKQTTYKEWSECYHELHNDLMAEDVFRYLVCWLDKQVSSI